SGRAPIMQSPTERMALTLAELCVPVLCGLLSGCAALSLEKPVPKAGPAPRAALSGGAAPKGRDQGIVLVSCANAPPTTAISQPGDPPFAGQLELNVEALIEQVLARNPSLSQMVAAWQAASARYPQVTSLEDPMFAATIGPGTIAPDDPGVEFASRLEISQKLPFPGKLKLRGDNALAEANAAGRDVDHVRLQLVESARSAFSDYYLADRTLAVNQESLRLLRDFRKDVVDRYEHKLATRHDVLQADVEIGREQDRRLELDQVRQVTVAR